MTIIGTDLLNDSISLGASSSYNASINGSLARTTDNIPGNWMSLESSLVITTGDGNDGVGGARLINEDSIDLGAGDDSITIMNGAYLTGGYTDGTPSLSDLNLSKLDGGERSDTLYFGEDVDHGTILTLDIGNAVNFENLRGGNFDDTMIGDDNSNMLYGADHSDTLYGHGGNDILYGGMVTINCMEAVAMTF